MKAYSQDLRIKVLEAIDRGMSKSEAARTFGLSRSSVKRYAAALQEGRPLAPKKHPGSKPKLDDSARKLLEADVEDRPALTLKDRRRFLEKMTGVSVSESTLCRLLKKRGFSPKGGAWVRAKETTLVATRIGLMRDRNHPETVISIHISVVAGDADRCLSPVCDSVS